MDPNRTLIAASREAGFDDPTSDTILDGNHNNNNIVTICDFSYILRGENGAFLDLRGPHRPSLRLSQGVAYFPNALYIIRLKEVPLCRGDRHEVANCV